MTPITCQRCSEQLTALMLGDLPPAEAEALRAHLDQCPACRGEARSIERTLGVLREALAADSGAPTALDPHRRRQIFAARPAGLRILLAPGTRRILRMAATLALGLGITALLLPSLSTSRLAMNKRASSPLSDGMDDGSLKRGNEPMLMRKSESKTLVADLPEPASAVWKEIEVEELDASEVLSGAASHADAGRERFDFEEDRMGADGSVPSDMKGPYVDRLGPGLEERRSKLNDGVTVADSYGGAETPRAGDKPARPSPTEPPRRALAPRSAAPITTPTLPGLGTDESDLGMDRGGAGARREKTRDEAKQKGQTTCEDSDDGPRETAKPAPVAFNPFVEVAQQPLSTFSIDVDTASYTVARRHLAAGQLPPPEGVRTEEFINFFDYHYAPPASGAFAIRTEAAPAPLGEGVLLKIGVKARSPGRDSRQPAMLTLVVDTSGSMATPDRIGLIKKSLRLLVDRLDPEDHVAIVQFDSQARLALEATPASRREALLEAVDAMQPSGSTHLEGALELGYEIAARHFRPGALNRVLLLSDGVANLGAASADEMLARVERHRRQGIFCSIYGFGVGTYDDAMLKRLASRGDGQYQFIDSEAEARRVFVEESAATRAVVASDVKIQVEFDGAAVRQYRQLGYESRQLAARDFRDDAVDAGEVGAGQSVTALYTLLLADVPGRALGVVRIRYRNVETGRIEEFAHPIARSDLRGDYAQASPGFKLATLAALFAEKLRGSPYAEAADYGEIAALLRPVALELSVDARVPELLRLVERAGSSR